MHYACLWLLAQQTTTTTTFWERGGQAFFITMGGAAAIATLLLLGVWVKFGEPLVKKTISAWHNDPENIGTRRTFIKEVIENEVQRVDGTIHKHTKEYTDNMKTEVLKAIDELKEMVVGDRSLQQEILTQLGTLTGTVNLLARKSVGSTSSADIVPQTGSHKVPSRDPRSDR